MSDDCVRPECIVNFETIHDTLKEIKGSQAKILRCLEGNGGIGLKARVERHSAYLAILGAAAVIIGGGIVSIAVALAK